MNTQVDPTTIGAFVTIVLAFLGIAKIMLSQATKDRESDRKERLRLAGAIEKMAENSGKNVKSMERLVEETKTGNEQSEKRNGHLGELIIKQSEQTQKIADVAVAKIVSNIDTQHVTKQNVDEQRVKKQVKE